MNAPVRVPPLAIARVPQGLRQSDIRLVGQAITERQLTPIRLDIGEPDFATPAHVLRAAEVAAGNRTSYTPSAGTEGFRIAAADYCAQRHQIAVDPDEVVIGAGATGALMACFTLLCDPGDEFLVPQPGFPCYRTQIQMAGGVPVGYPLRADSGWEPDFEKVEEQIGGRTKAIVINTPGNPTGSVFSESTMLRLANLAERHGLWIISDEVYADLAFAGHHTSALSVNRDRTLAIFSLSKSFAMTGWRVGFTVVPSHIAATLAAINSQMTASMNSVAQEAAESALRGSWSHIEDIHCSLKKRSEAVTGWLTDRGIPHTTPRGAFYQALPLAAGADSLSVANQLLDDGVALVPGTAFFEGATPFLRMSLIRAESELLRGLEIASPYLRH